MIFKQGVLKEEKIKLSIIQGESAFLKGYFPPAICFMRGFTPAPYFKGYAPYYCGVPPLRPALFLKKEGQKLS